MKTTESTSATNTSRRGSVRQNVFQPKSTSSVESDVFDATVKYAAESEVASFVRVSCNRSDLDPTIPPPHSTAIAATAQQQNA